MSWLLLVPGNGTRGVMDHLHQGSVFSPGTVPSCPGLGTRGGVGEGYKAIRQNETHEYITLHLSDFLLGSFDS